jgi:GntR family transcriptional regulator / MocR family aminotransferase
MAVEWANLGPELLVRLERRRGEPVGARLQHELRAAIQSGRLKAGERLPSTRAMARELGLSRGLVQDSYEQLMAEGYLDARVGSGTRVAAAAHPPKPSTTPPRRIARLAVDFGSGVPDLASFPLRDWLWALGEAGRAAPTAAANYGEDQGHAVLRDVVAAYLRRVRSAAAEPEDIVIVSGFTQGLRLVLASLAHAGHREIALEDPGHRDWDEIARRTGLRPLPVTVDSSGADVEALAATSARAVVLTPAHQTPTGVVLAPDRRQALVAWANERDGVVIEDDYDAEFRYDRQAVGSLQGLAPDRVVTIGSVSKSLAPTVRLGWVVLPPHLVDAVAREKRLTDRGSPGLDQLALAQLMLSGRYDRHLRRMRGVYAAKRLALVEALATAAPNVELSGLAAGFHAVARLPDHLDELTVATSARSRSVGLYPMARYRLKSDRHPPQLVLGFGNLSEPAIRRGIALVADLLDG